MSTNAKNIIRKEYLKNFSRKIKTRYVLVEKGNPVFNDLESYIAKINSTVNQIIQEMNIQITERQIPYINLQICYGDIINKRVRIFIHNDDTSFLYERNVKEQLEAEDEISHILDLLIAECYNKITISNLSCDAELVIDMSYLVIAVTDILLDIIMFNSYSFLKEMCIEDKKKFNIQKYEFFKSEKLSSFYKYSNNNKPLYYSLAFSARESDTSLDIKKYIDLWKMLIRRYFPKKLHIEKSIKEQLLQHVDFNELPHNLTSKFNDKDPGAYLVLRTNKDRTDDIHPQLYSLFGIKKYRKGRIKIVPISDFEKYIPLFENLDVSAFKIVKQ